MTLEHGSGGPRTPSPETAVLHQTAEGVKETSDEVDSTSESRLVDIVEFAPGKYQNGKSRRISEKEFERWMENPGRRKYGPSYLPAVLRGGRRGHEEVLARSLVTLDLDVATEDTWRRILALPFRAHVHTTFSSTPEALRLRLILPLDRDASPAEYPLLVAAIAPRLGGEVEVDKKSFAVEQVMFRPAVADEHRDDYRAVTVPGPTAVVEELLAEAPEPEAPAVDRGAKRDPLELPGAVGAFNRAYSIAEAISAFGIPYESAGEGLWRPVGSSHPAGVREVAPGLVYSHHTNDPAYEQTLSAFDLVRVHLYGLLDEGTAEGTTIHKLPSTLAMTEKVQDDPRVTEELEAAETAEIDVFEVLPEEPEPFDRPDAGSGFETDVARELLRLQVRAEAQRRFNIESATAPVEFDVDLLVDHMLRPPPPAERVKDLIPWSGGTAIIAMRKTGKTTLELNLARSLITGEPFLDRFDVIPVKGRVAFLNFEVSGAMLTQWAAEAGIPPDRFLLVNLRGTGNPFADPDALARLGALLRQYEVESLIVDPFGRAFTGDSQNDAGQVQRWLLDLDQFARETAGVLDVILSVHAGWDGERTRGSSAIEDWGDSLIYLTRDPEEKGDPARFFRGDGRDIDVPEDQLHFDRTTRRLSLTGRGDRRVSRAKRKIDSLLPDVVGVIEAEPGILTGAIEARLRDAGSAFQKGDGSRAAKAAEEQNLVRSEPGKGTSVRWFPVPGGVVFLPDEADNPLGESPRGGSPK